MRERERERREDGEGKRESGVRRKSTERDWRETEAERERADRKIEMEEEQVYCRVCSQVSHRSGETESCIYIVFQFTEVHVYQVETLNESWVYVVRSLHVWCCWTNVKRLKETLLQGSDWLF